MRLEEGVEMVLHALEVAWGGELYVPKIPSYQISDLAEAIAPDCEHRVVGIRPGEKIHEPMISSSDSYTTYDLGKYYAILPQVPVWEIDDYIKAFNAQLVEPGFEYDSGENPERLSIEEIRALIKEKVDPRFEVAVK